MTTDANAFKEAFESAQRNNAGLTSTKKGPTEAEEKKEVGEKSEPAAAKEEPEKKSAESEAERKDVVADQE